MVRVCLLACASVLLSSSSAALGLDPNFRFERVADAGTIVPGGNGTFGIASFTAVSIDGNNVSFNAFNNARGTYARIDGVLQLIANESTPLPQGGGNFETLFDINTGGMEDGAVLFGANRISPSWESLYLSKNGQLSVVVDSDTAGPFSNLRLQFASLDGERVAFAARTGVYTAENGNYIAIATKNTAVPGGTGQFTNLLTPSWPSLSGDNVIFGGRDEANMDGIYISRAGTLELIANEQTLIPGFGSAFTGFGRFIDVSGDKVAFLGLGSGGYRGMFTWDDGVFQLVADTMTPVPDGVGNFVDLSEWVSIEGDHVAFWGRDTAGNFGLFTNLSGTLTKVVGTGDVLDGDVVHAARISRDGLEGNKIAFSVLRGTNNNGVYVATYIPEASSLLMTSIGLTIVLVSLVLRMNRSGQRVPDQIQSLGEKDV